MVDSVVNCMIPTNAGMMSTLEVLCLKPSPYAVESMKTLLEAGADPNVGDTYPLLTAVQRLAVIPSDYPKDEPHGTLRENHAAYHLVRVLLRGGANPFRRVARFKLSAFELLLGCDVPSDIIKLCVVGLMDGTFVPDMNYPSDFEDDSGVPESKN